MTKGWKIINGNVPVLLVALHNYPQIRNREIKSADTGTGRIVEELCQLTNCWGIISESIMPDPNWYKNSEFRRATKKLITDKKILAVVDIHGRRNNWPTIIDYYPNEMFKIMFPKVLENLSVKKFIDNFQLTLVEDLNKQKIAGVEVEIRRDGRKKGTIEYCQSLETIKIIISKIVRYRLSELEEKMNQEMAKVEINLQLLTNEVERLEKKREKGKN